MSLRMSSMDAHSIPSDRPLAGPGRSPSPSRPWLSRTARRIVALLGHGEHCVCDAGEMLGLSPALVSHHLRTLRAAGLLRERKSGRWVYYSLDLERVAALRAAVADLLTPTPAATTACLCSDCGPQRTAIPEPGPLRRLPLVAELSS